MRLLTDAVVTSDSSSSAGGGVGVGTMIAAEGAHLSGERVAEFSGMVSVFPPTFDSKTRTTV